jgi:hypothetical protein
LGYWLAWLNILALVIGLGEYIYGIAIFIPDNGASALIYRSTISADRYRIPSTFTHAHAFGGAMLLSIPILVWVFLLRESGKKRILITAGISAALAGILLSSTRSNVAMAVVGAAVSVALVRNIAVSRLLPLVAVASIVIYVVVGSMDEESQRFRDLGQMDTIADRFDTPQAALERVTDTLAKYPMGNGLARAQGISIPYFLQDDSTQDRDITTGESEFVRMAGTQGTIGLLLFVSFLVWFFAKKPAPDTLARLAYGFSLAVCLSCYASVGAFMGVPVGVMLLLLMGRVRYTAPQPVVKRTAALLQPTLDPLKYKDRLVQGSAHRGNGCPANDRPFMAR